MNNSPIFLIPYELQKYQGIPMEALGDFFSQSMF